jgi:ABC-type Mn2+/Zn2+ transport system permease subunit
MGGWLDGTPLAAIPGATLAALISGTLLPLLGTWVVYQRIVFLGVTLAQVAAAGVALGLLLDLPPLPMGFLLCALMAGLVARGFRGGLGSGGDSALGAAFCVASALALLFISRSPAELEEIERVLHGNLIFALPQDVWRVTIALLGGLAVIAVFFRQILFSAFDGEAAAALGLRPRAWLMLLFVVLAVVLTLSMSTTGSLLTSALLVLPPLAALQFRRGMKASFALASLLGFLATLSGLLLAVTADLHLESSIVVTSFLLLPLVACWRISPLIALALVAALAWLAPRLAPVEDVPHAPGMPHAHAEPSADLPDDIAALLAEARGEAGTRAETEAGTGTPGAVDADVADQDGASERAPAPQDAEADASESARAPAPSPTTAPTEAGVPGAGASGASGNATSGASGTAASGASGAAASGASSSPVPAHHAGELEVHLFAQPATEAGSIEVSWTLELRRAVPPAPLPRTLWLLTTGCGATDERPIVRDTARLPPGDQILTGGFTLTGTTSTGPLAGQLWTGPRGAEDSTPVPDSVVHPSTAPAAHGHR